MRVVIAVVFVSVQSVFCYSIPEPKFEILEPKGFRVSIPDEPGLRLFAFHGAVDHRVEASQPGDLVGEVIKPTNGRWVYENRKFFLEPGQTIYYWIHVQHESRGYRLTDKQYRVGSGSGSQEPVTTPTKPTSPPETCGETKTTVRGRNVCQGELIFEDNFNILNSTAWRREVRIPLDVDDADFVMYDDKPDNCYITEGKLYIQPNRIEDIPGYDEIKIRSGEINFGEKCTGIVDPERECKRQAGLFRILPPIVSGRINTKDSFSFRYGKIEVRAKLPKGDWLFPLIALEPQTSDYGISGYASGQLRVAYIRANPVLRTRSGQAIDGSYLFGGAILKTGEADRDSWLKSIQGSEHWGNQFHTYSLTWTDNSITLAVDGSPYAIINGGFNRNSASAMAPFDKEFYITLALSAGGISDFPDGCMSGVNVKPWQNSHPKAELMFWNARDKWGRTWTEQSSRLVVDYVRVWAL